MAIQDKKENENMAIQVQQKAPDFKGQAVVGTGFKEITLESYKGKWLVLFFYPLDFTFVCPTEIIAFSDRCQDFKKIGAEIVACSVDSHFTHLAWVNTPRNKGGLGELNIPLLADLDKSIGKNYGVLLKAGIRISRSRCCNKIVINNTVKNGKLWWIRIRIIPILYSANGTPTCRCIIGIFCIA